MPRTEWQSKGLTKGAAGIFEQTYFYLRESTVMNMDWKYLGYKYFQLIISQLAGWFPVYGVDVSVAVAVDVGVAVEVAVGDGVAVADDSVGVSEEVGVKVGACELCRVMRGDSQRAKSSCELPLVSTVRINFTRCPLKELRSMLMA